MNREQAKEALKRHRPGTDDAQDPEIARALELASADEELSVWFRSYQSSQESIRRALRRLKAPPGLKEQIITEKPLVTSQSESSGNWKLLAAAVLVIAAALAIILQLERPEQTRFNRFETRMVKKALRLYAMDLETNKPEEIREFLAQAGAPSHYEFPAGLSGIPLTGCAAIKFEGKPVSMICFQTKNKLKAGAKSDLWLFVADSRSVSHQPPGGQTVFNKTGDATTVSWSAGGFTYLMVTSEGEQTLRSLL